MSLFIALLIGTAIGVIGGLVFTRDPDYLLINILISLAGAILGLALYVLSDEASSAMLFTWLGAFSSLLGALAAELLYLSARSFSHKKRDSS